jgi:hypothetical protein
LCAISCLSVSKKAKDTEEKDSAQSGDTAEVSNPEDSVNPEEDSLTDTSGYDFIEPKDQNGKDNSADISTDTAKDTGKDDAGQACSKFSIKKFYEKNGKSDAVYGEKVEFASEVENKDGSLTYEIQVQQNEMNEFLNDNGNGTGTFIYQTASKLPFGFKSVDMTFTLTVSDGNCSDKKELKIILLGNVWITNVKNDVVDVFRSDGGFLGTVISNIYLNSKDPWSLLQIDGDRMAVGERYGSADLYYLDGTHIAEFDGKDKQGAYLWGAGGAYSMMVHSKTSEVWVGGPSGIFLIFDKDGKYLKKLNLDYYSDQVESIGQFKDGSIVVNDESSLAWDFSLYDQYGQFIGSWGKNSEIELMIYRFTINSEGNLVANARNNNSVGYIAELNPNGQIVKYSQALKTTNPPKDITPEYGITEFGSHYLAVAKDKEYNELVLQMSKTDFSIEKESFTGETTGDYRGIVLLK